MQGERLKRGKNGVRELLARKKMRLQDYDYSSAGYYFITICVKDKYELLGKVVVGATVPGRPQTFPYVELSEIGQVVDIAINHNNRNHVSVPKYVIMPNHIHMILILGQEAGNRGRSPLQGIVRSMKAYITKQIGYSIWQKSFHDHIIRNEEEYRRIWRYIDENPVKWEEDCYFVG
ncbi:MAG: hypothetical protein FWH16_02520 [Oscillospiraceae bacterium]|nr:hypothetical protein [Oscillospiraceae bacterium]